MAERNGFKASLRRFTRIGKWKPLSNNYTYFTTGPIIPSEWGLKPIIPRTANFGKRLGRQFHTSLGTSGFKLKGYSNILVNEPIKSSNWKLIRGTGGFLWESSAHVLSLAGITAWGDLLIDGCQTEFKTFRQD